MHHRPELVGLMVPQRGGIKMRRMKVLGILMACALILLLALVMIKRDVSAGISTEVVLKLINGEELVGTIVRDTGSTIELEREPAARNLTIMKQAILYYYEIAP